MEKNCIARNVKNIKTTLEYGEVTIEIDQRKLTVGEVNAYDKSTDSVYKDKDVFEALVKNKEVLLANKKTKAEFKKKYDILMINDVLTEEEKVEKLDQLDTDFASALVKLDTETDFLVQKTTEQFEDRAFELDIKLIKYSVTSSRYNGGYIKENGIEVLEDDLEDALRGLEPDDFIKLKDNVKTLMNPSDNDIEDAKS